MISQIEQLHALYCRLTGFSTRLAEYGRERWWYEYLKAGFTAKDLDLVISHLQRGIHSGERRKGCLRFSNLIEQTDRFEEELDLARAHARNNRPRTNREAIVQAFRPQAAETALGPKAKPAKDVLVKLSEELRKAVQ